MSILMEKYQLAPKFQNALIFGQLTNAQVLGMTTAAELASQSTTNGASLHFDERRNIERCVNTSDGPFTLALAADVFTDTNVAAADTVAGLTALLTTLNAGVTLNYFSGTHLAD